MVKIALTSTAFVRVMDEQTDRRGALCIHGCCRALRWTTVLIISVSRYLRTHFCLVFTLCRQHSKFFTYRRTWVLGYCGVTGHSRCRCLNRCFCVEPSINPVDLSWLGQCIDGRSVKRLNLEIKRIEIALLSTMWSVTWPSIFGEDHICWVPGQWKERTATPGHVFVSDSSVTVGLNSVLNCI